MGYIIGPSIGIGAEIAALNNGDIWLVAFVSILLGSNLTVTYFNMKAARVAKSQE
jgi:hypothetical protein